MRYFLLLFSILLCLNLASAQTIETSTPVQLPLGATTSYPVNSSVNATIHPTGTCTSTFNCSMIIQGFNCTVAGCGGGSNHTAGSVQIIGGNGAGGRGGNVFITAGTQTVSADSGYLIFSAGSCGTATTCNVGAIQFTTPNCVAASTCNQHGVTWTVGSVNQANTPGGVITFTAGNATGTGTSPGGAINLTAGNSTNGVGGIITLNPGTGGSSNGFVNIQSLTTGTNADFMCVDGSGNLLIQSSACTISSMRFKKDIHRVHTDALDEIGQIPVVSFKMKAHNADPNGDRVQTGLLAEDIARIAPECAIYENDMKTPKSYRQECVIALLVKAVQQLRTR
jgi:hypothetical protein